MAFSAGSWSWTLDVPLLKRSNEIILPRNGHTNFFSQKDNVDVEEFDGICVKCHMRSNYFPNGINNKGKTPKEAGFYHVVGLWKLVNTMLQVDLLTSAVVFCLFVAVLVASVLVILQCGDCWHQNEYEQLRDFKPVVATTDRQIKKVIEDREQQDKNITEVLYYIRSLPGSQLLTDYKLWGMGWRADRTNFLVSYQDHVNIISLLKKGENCALPWNRNGKDALCKVLNHAI